MRSNKLSVLIFVFVIALLTPVMAFGTGKGVLNSPHNLSATSGNSYSISTEQRVCVFCHTPHNALNTGLAMAPLWNRALSTQDYIPYASTYFTNTLHLPSNQPNGASRICLSCHDGSIAPSAYGGRAASGPPITGTANLGIDLSDDHPVSFIYPTVPTSSLVSPNLLPAAVKLDNSGYLQCTSCHDPHNNEYTNFLVMDNNGPTSPLCVACHTHSPSGSVSEIIPLHSTFANGCMNCHATHNASVHEYLLKAPIDVVCFANGCHSTGTGIHLSQNGLDSVRIAAVPGKSIWNFILNSVFLANKPDRTLQRDETGVDLKSLFERQIYRHPIGENRGAHDRKERMPIRQTHVECVDCHDAHLAASPAATVGLKRSLKGVSGVSADTLVSTIAAKEYEICYKCHSGGAAGRFVALRKASRMIQEPDQMVRFRASNPSIHPVAADRRGNGDSLLAEFRTSMIRIDCSDCHNSDESKKAGGIGANGPHASRYEHILMARYEMPSGNGRTQTACNAYRTDYDLCFRCHADQFIMVNGTAFANGSVNEHAKHVIDRCIPCAACHDPHGVPSQGGGTVANNAHLINFDRNYAAGRSTPTPRYVSAGIGKGSCTVTCHSGTARSYAR